MTCKHDILIYEFVISRRRRRLYACKKCRHYLKHKDGILTIVESLENGKLYDEEPSVYYGWKEYVNT